MPVGEIERKIKTMKADLVKLAERIDLLKGDDMAARVLAGSVTADANHVDMGVLGSTEPISRKFGFDRGLCIDRYYIERFLDRQADDVRGHVLEVAEDTYARRFGGSAISDVDILHIEPSCGAATVVRDLCDHDAWQSHQYDAIILTQTLQHIYDTRAAVMTLERILKPGGVLLLSAPGISQVSRYDMDRWGDYWRFTDLSIRKLLEEQFTKDNVTVESFGNVAAAAAFLHGLSADELTANQLEHHDVDYQMVIVARAVKMRANTVGESS